MGNFLESSKKHAYTRRQNPNSNSQSNFQDLDKISINKETSDEDVQLQLTQPQEEISTSCSDFYLACRNNQIDKVRKLIGKMSLDEIDRVEPNGSTALHAACYYGHCDIVKLLLEIGADRAIANKYKYLPFDEAKSDDIKELFFRVPTSNRVVSNTGDIEWDLFDNEVQEKAQEEINIIKTIYHSTDLKKMFERIQTNYIEKGLANFDGIDKIKRFFQKATKEQDPIWILKAYTAETDFYKILNQEIAGGATQCQSERRYLIAILLHHPSLDRFIFTGLCYRVYQINAHSLNKYQINSLLMTKSFLSSSIDRKLAELFLCQKESNQKENPVQLRKKVDGTTIKTWLMCIYHVKHQRTALHIENCSQYANEGEVLIMPFTVFQVKTINQIKPSYLSKEQSITQIELEQYQQ